MTTKKYETIKVEKEDGITRVGNHNCFHNSSHIAHDCMVGDHTLFVNGAQLAGHIGGELRGAGHQEEGVTGLGAAEFADGFDGRLVEQFCDRGFPAIGRICDPDQAAGAEALGRFG